MTSNGIEVIPSPSEDSVLLSGLRHLALAHNAITAWSTIDSLSQWCPILETLSLSGSPLVGARGLVTHRFMIDNFNSPRHGNGKERPAIRNRKDTYSVNTGRRGCEFILVDLVSNEYLHFDGPQSDLVKGANRLRNILSFPHSESRARIGR